MEFAIDIKTIQPVDIGGKSLVSKNYYATRYRYSPSANVVSRHVIYGKVYVLYKRYIE